jgi:DNA uptake protein ComE-like DNA-binding protein
MLHRRLAPFLLLMALLAACAPADLDITPSPVPTAVPTIKVYITGAVKDSGKTIDLPLGSRTEDAIKAAGGAADKADLQRVNLAQVLQDGQQINVPKMGESLVVQAEATAQPTVVVANNQTTLDKLLATFAGPIEAGSITWTRDKTIDTSYVDRDGGITGRITFNEAGGGQMELTIGVFDTSDKAKSYFDKVSGQIEQPTPRDGFPTPNAFGKGTYGSDAIFVQDTIFVRVSIPRFSSTLGDPLGPTSRPVLANIDQTLKSG